VIAAMLLKGRIIYTYSASQRIFIVLAVFYFIRYFPLHELTQLRAACALALLLIATNYFWKGNKFSGIIIFSTALMFHMSTAFAIPALFFFKITKRWLVIIIGIGFFTIASLGASIVSIYLTSYITVLSAYESQGWGEWAPNPFAITIILDWAMIVFSLVKWNSITLLMKRAIVLEIIGMALFYGLLDFPAFASRVRDIYSIFWLIYIADGLQLKKLRIPIMSFVTSSLLVYSYIYFIKGDFFK
jgi:hypothetical protein